MDELVAVRIKRLPDLGGWGHVDRDLLLVRTRKGAAGRRYARFYVHLRVGLCHVIEGCCDGKELG